MLFGDLLDEEVKMNVALFTWMLFVTIFLVVITLRVMELCKTAGCV